MLLAVLFVGSGLLTFQIYSWISKAGADEFQLVLQLLTGLPFGIACSLRFIRRRWWIPLSILLDCITWTLAYRLALGLAGVNAYFATAVAGLVGALGVTASTGLGCRILFSRRTFIIVSLVGLLAGVPFGLILDRSAQENLILAIAFPVWQTAVGMWIWMNARQASS